MCAGNTLLLRKHTHRKRVLFQPQPGFRHLGMEAVHQNEKKKKEKLQSTPFAIYSDLIMSSPFCFILR